MIDICTTPDSESQTPVLLIPLPSSRPIIVLRIARRRGLARSGKSAKSAVQIPWSGDLRYRHHGRRVHLAATFACAVRALIRNYRLLYVKPRLCEYQSHRVGAGLTARHKYAIGAARCIRLPNPIIESYYLLNRQIRVTHQALIYLARHLSAFADRPDNE